MDTAHLAAGKFGAPIPTMAEAIQVGDDEYIDKDGNKFNRASILMNEHFGGGLERVSASLFDDPKGLRDNYTASEKKKFRKLDRRIEAIGEDRQIRNEYPVNENGVMLIPRISDDDRPDDVALEDWQQYMKWKFQE